MPVPIRWVNLPHEPWRNGRGITRTVASHSERGQLRWRISVADIEQDGSFSTFPGLHRTAVLMDGVGLSLESKRTCHRFGDLGAACQFDGEEEVHARLNGTRARLWNIMVASDSLETTIHVARGSQVALLKASTCALLALGGVVTLSRNEQSLVRIHQDEIVILDRHAAGEVTLTTENAGALWALATIRKSRVEDPSTPA